MATDLVCGMIVKENSAPARTTYEGTEYYFCAPYCKERFDGEPEKFIHNIKEWGETTDPVCGMSVKIPDAAAMSVYNGRLIYFCSASCKEKFDSSPEVFLKVDEDTRRASSMPAQGLKKVELPITGMSCASCVARIEKGLSKMSGITDVPESISIRRRFMWGILSQPSRTWDTKLELRKSHCPCVGCPAHPV